MAEESLYIRWETHHGLFTRMLSQMRTKEQYCDATILCEENFYEVHRFVLAACSSYFEQIFSRLESRHPVIVLTDIKAVHLEALLMYMYNGEIRVSQKILPNVLHAACSLKIKGFECDEALMENKKEVMSPDFATSGQLGKEGSKIMDFDSRSKAVKQKRQSSSPKTLISSSSTPEKNSEVIEIGTKIVQPPTDPIFLVELDSENSSDDGSEQHEALMLWNGRWDSSNQKKIDQAQNCIVNDDNLTIKSIMEDIEVKNELLDLTPEEYSVYNSNCFETDWRSTNNQADFSRTSQLNSLQDKDNEMSSQTAPSTSNTDKFHNGMFMASSRVLVSNSVSENPSDNMQYRRQLFNSSSNSHEIVAELDNSDGDESDQYNERSQSYSSNVACKSTSVKRVLRMNVDPAESCDGLNQIRIENTLSLANPTDDPVLSKSGMVQPKRLKSYDSSNMESSAQGSGMIFEGQNNNFEIGVTRKASIESLRDSLEAKKRLRKRERWSSSYT